MNQVDNHDPVNILMVDDQPGKLMGYEAILGELGENLLQASDGRGALEQLLKHDVAVILMDVCMPEQDGFELVEVIRQHHRFRETAIIFVSAVQMSDMDLIKGYNSGAVDYVSVPVIPEILRAKVSVFIDLYRKTRALERLNQGLEERVNERTAKLLESEERFRLMADTIPSLVWTADTEGNLTYANGQCVNFLGEVQMEKGNQLLESIHPDELDKSKKAWKKALASGQPFEIEHRTRRHDGQYCWYLTRALPHMDEAGKRIAWFGVSTEIEVQKQAEKKLKESEQMYKAIGDSIDYGVWICDADGRNIYSSDSFLHLLQITQEECSNETWLESQKPEQREAFTLVWDRALETGKPWSEELSIDDPSGATHPILFRGVPVKGSDDQIAAWVGINLDISQIKSAEQELRDADRRKDEFLATLAHELRNPLAPICSSVELIRQRESMDPVIREAVDTMSRQMAQMIRLINDLMDVSRITRNKLELQVERTSLVEVIKVAIELAQPAISAGEHNLTTIMPEASVEVMADPTRLAQVLSNLLTNAAKYTPAKGDISMESRVADGQVLLLIRDSGMGISEGDRRRLFEPFYQVDRSISRAQGGLGIGLTLVKKIVEMHAGQVEVSSDGPGKGSTFTVRLPHTQIALETPEPSNGQALVGIAKTGTRVLVVDDNRDAALTLSMLLRYSGCEVMTCEDGQQAVSAVEVFQPDMVLMDLGMPGMSGYEAAEAIRQQSWGRNIFLVAVTGWGQPEDIKRTRDAGFDHHLVKPVSFSTIEGLIESLANGLPEVFPVTTH